MMPAALIYALSSDETRSAFKRAYAARQTGRDTERVDGPRRRRRRASRD